MLDFFIAKWSYLGIITVLVLTGCGLPIPEEVPIVLAGVLSQMGRMDPWLAYGSCLIGAILGDSLMYAIGYHWGHNLLKDHPRFARFLHAEREERFEEVIQNHGLKVMLLARFMVGIRAPVYLAAGIVRIPFRRFLLIDLFCATLVVSVVFGLSFLVGRQAVDFVRNFELGLTGVAVVAGLAVAGYFLWKRRNKIVDRVVGPENDSAPKKDGKDLPPQHREKTVA